MTAGKTKGRALEVSFTKSQLAYLELKCMNPGYFGGMGSGKTYIMGFKAVTEAHHSPNAIIGIYEPTYPLVKTVAIPIVEHWLTEFGITYRVNHQDHTIMTSSSGVGDFLFRSMDNPDTLVGFEHYRAHLDELDTLNTDLATTAWTKVLGRNRQRPSGVKESEMIWNDKLKRMEHKNTMSAYSTPEGYKFCYNQWVLKNDKNYQCVHAKTTDNPALTDSYIENMKNSLSEEMIAAYMNGEFCNMQAGTVYKDYNRDLHNSTETIMMGETLYIGCDFNVTKQAATVWVKRNGGAHWHVVDEMTDMYDTPEMVRIITERYKNKGHHIVMYPDASGASRKTVNASSSDIALLKQAGFEVRAHKKNPDVRDRIAATNNAFSKGRLYVNFKMAPNTSRCLLQQAYNKNNEPDKRSGHDHQNDATTYPIAYEMMINKPLFKIDFKFM